MLGAWRERAAAKRYRACMELGNAVDVLRARVPGLALVVLHGSRARGDARSDSDVDVALLADAPLDTLTLLDLQSALEPHLGATVDLVDLWSSDDVLRVQVIEHGRVAFERSPTGFRNVAVHDYRRLDLDVVESIIERHLDDLLACTRLALEHGEA